MTTEQQMTMRLGSMEATQSSSSSATATSSASTPTTPAASTTNSSTSAAAPRRSQGAPQPHSLARARRAPQNPSDGRAHAAAHGHHLQRLRRRARRREDLSVRHRPAHRRAPEWTTIERGLKQRIKRSTCSSTTSITSSRSSNEGIVPRDLVDGAAQLPRSRAAASSRRGRLVPHHRHRSGPRRRRPSLRARRQPALPVGRVVRAAKPRGDEAHFPADLSRPRRCGRSTTIPAAC